MIRTGAGRAAAAAVALLVLGTAQALGAEPDAEMLARARALLERAPLIDAHNDLPSMLLEVYGGDLTRVDLGQVQQGLCADVPRLREGRVGAQFWSVWAASPHMRTGTSLREAVRELDVTLRFIRSRPELELARTADDIERIHDGGKIAALIGVEGGHTIEGTLAALRVFHELGASYLTLTHWDTVPWADAATDRGDHGGLTEFGERVVREMNRLGMLVDVSHVSADTMKDVLRVTSAPVIFSHSNAFAVVANPRNVPDDVLRLIARNGGVVHVNFIKEYVTPLDAAYQARKAAAFEEIHARLDDAAEIARAAAAWAADNPPPRGTIADVADHIDHIRAVAGVDHAGIGSDFYDAGRGSMAAGLDDVTRYPYLFAELLRRGYSDDEVLKIAGRNTLRAMREVQRVAAGMSALPPDVADDGTR